uniref:PDZ domain-containing protein n=2 Tax=Stomoxys calcitrans TaxID=35570 RepID=A0A1I8PQE1_STOCA
MAGGSSANSGGGLASSNSGQRNSVNMAANTRRPQLQISSPIAGESPKNFLFLTLTVRKDENGYGMKVSGDNPVFVESVKPGGAAQIAGLVAGDMILKVNGFEVRSEKHPTVVSLIKASTIVELAVKRSQKLVRPSSVGIVPSTPVLGRDRTASITGPQPVDSIKRREMETYKIKTLQKMLEQELLNLERLKGDTNNPSYKLSDANVKKLREQLRQVGAEAQHPRNSAQQLFHLHQQQLQQLQQQHQGKGTPKSSKSKNKFTAQSKSVIEEDDVPPPLPQRNLPRQLQMDATNNNAASQGFSPISDLDNAAAGGTNSPVRNSPQPPLSAAASTP